MANKKMTYTEALTNAINFLNENIQYGDDFAEVVERLNALKEQLAKRNSSGSLKKPTKTQRENEEFKVKIVDMLKEDVDGMTATEIGSALAVSCQKASAILSQMVKAEVVRKVKEGKVTRFVLA
jgi:predicted transcriptional regulator